MLFKLKESKFNTITWYLLSIKLRDYRFGPVDGKLFWLLMAKNGTKIILAPNDVGYFRFFLLEVVIHNSLRVSGLHSFRLQPFQ